VGKYRILIKASAAKEIEAVGQKKDRQRIVRQIQSFADNPRPAGCEKLSGQSDRYRVREGDFRIVYSVDDRTVVVNVAKVGHRKEVYR
jgi:mRNA interferase RelE/StbE